MDEMKPLMSVGETLQDYFTKAMLEMVNRPSSFPMPNPNLRNEAYYAKQNEPVSDDFTRCPNCGHCLEISNY